MDRPLSLWRRPAATRLAAALALTVSALPAQGDPRARVVQQAIEALADPATAPDAITRLQHLGAYAVPKLQELLRHNRRREVPPVARGNALFALGRMGRAALPALTELRDVIQFDEEWIATQACWTLSALAPFMTKEQLAATVKELETALFDVRRYWLGRVLVVQAEIPGETEEQGLVAMLEQSDLECIAACRWLTCQPERRWEQKDEMLTRIRHRLDRLLQRAPVSWFGQRPGNFTAGDLAAAWLQLSGEPADLAVARGLLEHWEAERRMRGVRRLHEKGASAPLLERADLVGRLWDSETGIALAAASAFAAWGKAAVVALPALRLHERTHQNAELAKACGKAADAVLGACGDLPPCDRALLLAIDAALRGQPAQAGAGPFTVAGLSLASETLLMAQWNDLASLDAVLRIVEDAGPCRDDAIRHVFGWLQHEEKVTAELAMAWLARRGAAVRAAVASAGAPAGLEDLCRGQIWSGWRTAIEFAAQQFAAGADAELRRALLDDANARTVSHALAVSLAQPRGELRRATDRLRELLEPPAEPGLVLIKGQGRMLRPIPVDLADQVRTLAAIALADLGADFTPPPDLEAVVKRIAGAPLDGLPAWVADMRKQNALVPLLDRIEDECRRLLGVPAHLRWPSVAQAAR